MVPASAGIETFPFRAAGLFLPEDPEVLRALDVRRTVGVFLIFIPAVDPPISGGAGFLLWTIFGFFGTD